MSCEIINCTSASNRTVYLHFLDLVNKNMFNPRPFEGKNGSPVLVPAKDFYKMQQLFQINRFNLMASDRIPLNRSLPDVRRKG